MGTQGERVEGEYRKDRLTIPIAIQDAIRTRYRGGDCTTRELAKEFGFSTRTIRVCIHRDDKKADALDCSNRSGIRSKTFEDFMSDVRKFLWNMPPNDRQHAVYYDWLEAVRILIEEKNVAKNFAYVEACKEVRELVQFFRKYDVKKFDRFPESNSAIAEIYDKFWPATMQPIRCENREQSHRENLAWAIQAAGERLRTGRDPATCPNDSAFYLYTQARDDPKDFLARFTSIEAKRGDGDSVNRAQSGKAVSEINMMLSTILDDTPEEGEVVPVRLA